MTKLSELISQLSIWDGWRDNYNSFVPKFIEEAKTGKDWSEWDPRVFNEFLEKGGDQCISSLRQGCFSNKEKETIKKNWSELAPLLKTLAESQEEPRFDVYDEIKKTIRKYTSNDKRAATNRLVASLQPKFLCTIINRYKLQSLYYYLQENVECTLPEYNHENWFVNSYNLWKFYQEQLPEWDLKDMITLPWQTYAFFIEGDQEQEEESNDMSENPFVENTIEILKSKHQIILQGAPGTGKTFSGKDVAEKLIFGSVSGDKKEQSRRLSACDQFKLVQLHPSYTYEDFVRGIVVETEDGIPTYRSRNKILGEFARKASQNLENSKKGVTLLQKEYTFEAGLEEFKQVVQEKISQPDNNMGYGLTGTDASIVEVANESFRYKMRNNPSYIKNLLYSDLLKMANSGREISIVKDVDQCGLEMKGKSTYYFWIYNKIKALNVTPTVPVEKEEVKNYVLIIDEINRANLPAVLGELIYALEYRGEKVESMYEVEGDRSLVLPPNLYIIGTMNTADRSVGEIDYAIRRRFAFVEMLPKVLPDVEGFDLELFKKVSALFIENVDAYIKDETSTLKRSAYLSAEFRPEDVWIGHSYFIMDKRDRTMRVNYEIKPILKEYIKDGILKESAIDQVNALI